MSENALAEHLSQYAELCRRLDEKFAEIRAAQPTQFACRQGCHSCCKPALTVNRLEKQALANFILAEPGRAEHLLALEAANPHGGKRCAFLSEGGACQVYEARPLVCRSHGAPLQVRPLDSRDENLRVRDVCPLNFTGLDISRLAPESVINLDTLNTLLALLTKMAYPGDQTRAALKASAILAP